jgi:3-methylcrotonyl-CoA carboxylase alpha subunit
MFESVLIANRGEIACRVARTCRRLGIRTVAVYSDADIGARHVREADSAVRIGPPDATRSYLDAEAIIQAALASGATAIHPGYGFLSESTRLVERCTENGIVWIGPRAEVIEKMGSKIESKRIATRADVPCVPGYHGDDQDPRHLLAQARAIGTPLLIKASAGGGGKGMRRVDDLAAFLPQLELARKEAMRAFGDDRVLSEKLILRPRHLEVQLAGDHHGHLVHLFERECSIQRNYQKIIEEAPAPRLSPAVRERLLAAALKLGREIGYDSLGTVEFVLGEEDQTPYFLEMNTRLQVEHPVTEIVTGLDLVEWQIRIAQGESLPLEQSAIGIDGWAIEARINCEDPARGHRPELGTVGNYAEPSGSGVRTDSGIAGGSEIPSQYDSMVAKLIGHGASRAQAVERLRDALATFEASGIGTNQSLLLAIVEHSLFRSGRLTTGFLAEAFPGGWSADTSAVRDGRIAAAMASVRASGCVARADDRPDFWQRQSGYRFMAATGRRAEARLRVELEGETVAVAIARDGDAWQVRLGDDAPLAMRVHWLNPEQLLLTPAHGTPRRFTLAADREVTVVNHLGTRWRMHVVSEVQALARVAAQEEAQGNEVVAEMPGAITAINVAPGDAVEAGDVLGVMEAMKLIFPLAAPRTGTIATVRCAIGEIVPRGQTLVQLQPMEAAAPTT